VDLLNAEAPKCSKLESLKLWAAFALGMTVMIIAAAMFDYATFKNQFGTGGAAVSSADAAEISGLGGVAAEVDSPNDLIDDKHEVKKVSYEEVTQPFVGVEVTEIENPDGSKKILISRVLAKSPAEGAGLKEGDELIRFDHRDVDDIEALQGLISRKEPGDRVKIEILRDGGGVSVYVLLGSFVPDTEAQTDSSVIRITG